MINLDRWQEIYDTMRRHKLRTVLTSMSVAWGIFMLVLLTGAGEGLRAYAKYQFRDDASNSIWIDPGKTSIAYGGFPVGREIELDMDDYHALRQIPGVEKLTGRFYLWGQLIVSYKDKHSSFDVRSVHPDHLFIEKTIITQGRYLNELDIAERRKVAVIGEKVAEFLFADKDPIGEYISIRDITYRVIGVFQDVGGEGELRKIFIPITTAQMAYSGGTRIHALIFTVGKMNTAQSRALSDKVTTVLARRHDFSPDDKRALEVRNNVERFEQIMGIFDAIQVFVWIVGAGTIVAGIVGVSNIMMISVRERTKEFGVRKALGATPVSIVMLVVQESIVLTAVSGYLGLIGGIAILELFGKFIEFARDAQVNLGIALFATGLLVVCGALAGYFPARSAASVDPVVALRDE